MKIKSVIFDLDGVLVDAKEWHYEALNRALGLFGFAITRYDHLVTYDGLPTKKKLEMLTKERGFPKAFHPFIYELKQLYTMDVIFSRCKPCFQHEYCLSRLKAEGYKLALASNSIRQSVEAMMDKSNLAQYLDVMLSNEDVTKAKPDPEIYLKAASLIGIKPEESLVVEDNENGIASALAAGANVLSVTAAIDVTYDRVKERIRQLEEVS